MLCPCQGPKGEESYQYFPEELNKVKEVGSTFKLTLIQLKSKTPGLIKKVIELYHIPSETKKTVVHYQDIRWQDDQAEADEEHFSDIDVLIKNIKKVRKSSTKSPVVVHCSAGIGRTGTLISVYCILEAIGKLESIGSEIKTQDF